MNGKSFPQKLFPTKILLVEIFYGCKIISSKIGYIQDFHKKNSLVENYLWLKNHFLEKMIPTQNFHKNDFVR